jgi:3-isopropylmalate/(R)-2-methylmalate dehydratase small subunit
MLKGKALRLPLNDDINTDYIISGRYKFRIQDPAELARHIFEDIAGDFYSKVEKGSFLVAGRNFGMGSSREQAPIALKAAGISAIIASSFARIFYRNSFNIGLPLVECDTSSIEEGDELVLDLDKGLLKNITKNFETKIRPLSEIMKKLLEDGGIVEHFKKYGGFRFEP